MEEKKLNLSELENRVFTQLRLEHYKDSTTNNYRKFYDQIEKYMRMQGISEYSEKVGESFMRTKHAPSSSLRVYTCMLRRLNDCLNGNPYRCRRAESTQVICEAYKEILEGYLLSCEQNGNKSLTLHDKRQVCIRFLNHVEQAKCNDINKLTPELITKSLLIFENRDDYAIIRMFLHYLAEAGYMKTDMSGIVPHYKRKIPLPSVYSIDEIQKIENSIDISTDMGVRNLAMIRLATRMGLRAGDIAKLRWSEIDFETGQIDFIQEKTGQPLALIMPDEVSEALHEHFKVSGRRTDDDYVFHRMIAPYGKVSTTIIWQVTNSCIKHAQIDISGRRHGPHVFRSSLATAMVNDDVSYDTVRKILGHSDPNVIKHYARTDIEHLRACAIEPPLPTGMFAGFLSGRR